MAMTIRELIKEKSELLREVDKLGPVKAAEELVELASLLSSLNAETTEKHFILNQKKVELLNGSKFQGKPNSVALAKMLSEATQEYKDWLDRFMQGKALEEMIRSLKYYLRQASEEIKISSY